MSRSMANLSQPKLMTVEAWGDLDEDVEGELVDGLLEEEEMPSLLHEFVVAWLIEALCRWVGKRGGYVAASETKIAIASGRGRKPDLSVYLGKIPPLADSLVRVPPHLVVEVSSPRPRDVRRDRIDKVADYARAGIAYYWIVDPQMRSLEVFELDRNRRYAIALAASGGRVRIPGCAGLVLDLDALWRKIDKASVAEKPAPRARRSRNK